MATLKTRLDDLTAAIAAKAERLNTLKQDKANIRQDLSSNSTTYYPSVKAVRDVTDQKVDKVAGKVLSDNNYTDAEKSKLAGLESSKFRGTFTSAANLPLTGNTAGSYADVDSGTVDSPTVRYIWDVNDGEWTEQVGSSTQMTAQEIANQYHTVANEFTDAKSQQIETNKANIATNTANISANATAVANAQSDADAAQSTANTAVTKANNAQADADAAQADATQALTNAATAQTAANNAQSAADAAQSSANTAQSTANNAVSKADAAQADANAIETELNTYYKASFGTEFPDYAYNFNQATPNIQLA